MYIYIIVFRLQLLSYSLQINYCPMLLVLDFRDLREGRPKNWKSYPYQRQFMTFSVINCSRSLFSILLISLAKSEKSYHKVYTHA